MSETQGPWEVRQGGNEIFGMGWDITPPSGVRGQFQYEADARKAAAAPELLQQLELLVEHLVSNEVCDDRCADLVMARAAIAKAKGETP